jgi:exonuclease III
MNREPNDPTTKRLRIWQQNLGKSRNAQFNLVNTRNLHLEYDLILIQEPHIDTLGNTKATSAWRVVYPSSRTGDTIRSVILVNKHLDTNTWEQIQLTGTQDVTAIQIRNPSGRISIFNIYNDCNHSRTMALFNNFLSNNRAKLYSKDDDKMIWAGDFNRHHPLWEEERNAHLLTNRHVEKATPIIELMAEYDMGMALPRGYPTLEARRTKNWTRPDNIFISDETMDLITRCEAVPRLRGPATDHVPILTSIDIPLDKKTPQPTRNFRMTDWTDFNNALVAELGERIGEPEPITTIDEFNRIASEITAAIQAVIERVVPMTKPCPYIKRWWNKDLDDLKKRVNKLSELSWKYRAVDHPYHTELKNLREAYAVAIAKAKEEHWSEFLETAMDRELWIANRYITNPIGDGGAARVPTLR